MGLTSATYHYFLRKPTDETRDSEEAIAKTHQEKSRKFVRRAATYGTSKATVQRTVPPRAGHGRGRGMVDRSKGGSGARHSHQRPNYLSLWTDGQSENISTEKHI